MTTLNACAAIQYSDEMHCPVCRLRWDTNDTDPPMCGRAAPSIAPFMFGVDPGCKPGFSVATRAHDEDPKRSDRYVSALAPDPFNKFRP